MERNVIENINCLRGEKEEIAEKIRIIELKIRKLNEEGTVIDSVAGGKGGKDHFVIEGYPVSDYQKYMNTLIARKKINAELMEKIDGQISEAEEFIAGISDPLERRIVNLRCIEGLTWRQVATRIGGGNTDESVRKIFARMIEK